MTPFLKLILIVNLSLMIGALIGNIIGYAVYTYEMNLDRKKVNSEDEVLK